MATKHRADDDYPIGWKNKDYKFFVVNVQTLAIDSGWEYREDAMDRAVELKSEGGVPKVMTKPRVGDLVLDPKDRASWFPRRNGPESNPRLPPPSPRAQAFAEELRRRRRERNISQAELASKSGVGADTISLLESGKHAARPSTRRRLIEALGGLPAGAGVIPIRDDVRLAWRIEDDAQAPRENPAHDVKLNASELARIKSWIAKPYTIKDFRSTSDNCFHLALIFMWILKDRVGEAGFKHVKLVPTEHVSDTAAPGGLAIIYEEVAQDAEDIQSSGRMAPAEKELGCALEMLNGWSTAVVDTRKAVSQPQTKKASNRRPWPLRNPRLNPEPDSAKAEKVFEMWHKKSPNRVGALKLGCDEKDIMVCVGKAHNIVYRSGKWESGRKTNDYVHHFDSKPSVYMLGFVLESQGADVPSRKEKAVEQLLAKARNADGQFAVAELATPLSFGLDDGTTEGDDIDISSGARVYGAVDQKTVIIVDPKWKLIVIRGGQMYFDERGIVK